MAMGRFDFTSEAAAQAMLDGLVSRIGEALRERIMERIRPDVDAAVEAGLESFKASIQGYLDPTRLGGVVEVLVKDRRV